MLTTFISEHFVGSLSDDVFDRDLRLKEAELKNAYLKQEQYHWRLDIVLRITLYYTFLTSWCNEIRFYSMLTMFLEALIFPLSPAASSIFCLWRRTHFWMRSPLSWCDLARSLWSSTQRDWVSAPRSWQQFTWIKIKYINLFLLERTLLVCWGSKHRWFCHQYLWASLVFFGTEECPHID